MDQLMELTKHFQFQGEIADIRPYGNGHINDTYLVTGVDGKKSVRYILQKVNTYVFPEPDKMMKNIISVTSFLKQHSDDSRTVLTPIPTQNGEWFLQVGDDFYRAYHFVENSICLEHPENQDDFYQCAVAFGAFQNELRDFPAETLYETIPNFHNTPKRFRDFLDVVEKDACDRCKTAEEEIAFVKAREPFYGVLYEAYEKGQLPLRVTHNDTKSNNVMLNADTHEALCVIDLDTIMPGFSVTDFGDAIRFGASTATEDETDLSKVRMDLDMFRAYVKGFLDGCAGSLTREEVMLLPEGAKMMTMECGMRFLADYLAGDVYFKTAFPTHNLVRCRTQFTLAADMEKHWDEMKEIVKSFL